MTIVMVKMSRKNQIVLPKLVRHALGLRGGDQLSVQVKNGEVVIKAQPLSYTEQLAGMGAHLYKGFDDGFDPVIARREKERKEWTANERHRRELLGLPKRLPKQKPSPSTR